MKTVDLKTYRVRKGLSQVQAAGRLKVSQPYLALLESGKRRLTPELAKRATKAYDLPPTTVSPNPVSRRPVAPAVLVDDLANLGYPGFAYLRRRQSKPKNPAEVLLTALAQDELEARVVEALPWVLVTFADLDASWLVREAKLLDLQNRLGFVTALARGAATRMADASQEQTLRALEATLERSRLANEDTLCRSSLREPERQRLTEHRPEAARHWNVLTDWTSDALRWLA